MRYYRVIEGPNSLTHNDKTVMMWVILPESEALEERNAPIIACEQDLADQEHLLVISNFSHIDIFCGDKSFQYRTQKQILNDDDVLEKIILETEIGY